MSDRTSPISVPKAADRAYSYRHGQQVDRHRQRFDGRVRNAISLRKLGEAGRNRRRGQGRDEGVPGHDNHDQPLPGRVPVPRVRRIVLPALVNVLGSLEHLVLRERRLAMPIREYAVQPRCRMNMRSGRRSRVHSRERWRRGEYTPTTASPYIGGCYVEAPRNMREATLNDVPRRPTDRLLVYAEGATRRV